MKLFCLYINGKLVAKKPSASLCKRVGETEIARLWHFDSAEIHHPNGSDVWTWRDDYGDWIGTNAIQRAVREDFASPYLRMMTR